MRKVGISLLLLAAVALGCSASSTERAAALPEPVPAEQEGPVREEGVSASPLAKVKVGMSASEVESIAGSPIAKEREALDGRTEVWYYEGGVIILEDSQVKFSFVAPPRRS